MTDVWFKQKDLLGDRMCGNRSLPRPGKLQPFPCMLELTLHQVVEQLRNEGKPSKGKDYSCTKQVRFPQVLSEASKVDKLAGVPKPFSRILSSNAMEKPRDHTFILP